MRVIRRLLLGAALAVLTVLMHADPGAAQSLGTFRWQLLPLDEIVTLTVVQQGPVFVLSGFDDSAGAGRVATFGTAFFRPDGMIGMGLTTVFDGAAFHTSVVMDPVTLSGAWRDDGANAGTWVRK